MEEEEDMLPPFWLQPSDSFRQANRRLRRSSSSVFFSSGAFVLALLAIALVFVFFIIPSVLSFTSQIFRPHLVKKSWDSLNLVLVLFAIVCGFLSRNTNNDGNISSPSSYDQVHNQTVFNSSSPQAPKSNPSTPRQWFDQYSDRTVYNHSSSSTSAAMNRGVRTSSSYPDLRQQEASWVAREDRWRFYDDTHVVNYRVSGSDPLHHRRHRSWHEESVQLPVEEEAEQVQTKTIQVDTFAIRTEQVNSPHTQIPTAQSDPPLQPSPSPPRRSPSPSQPPPPTTRKSRRTYQAIGEKENSGSTQSLERNDNLEAKKNLPLPPARSPPSPPSPPPRISKSAGKDVKKRGVATTKEFLITSLRRKKKKQRQKSVENFESLLASASSAPYSLLPPPSPPPPPPPLPPPPSVFHNLFSSKKSNKPKKTMQSIPQPPPPPPVAAKASTAHLLKTKAQMRAMMATQKPPLPVKVSTFINEDDENANSGGESPLVRIPPPPPLPPFRMPEMKFVVHGDFVRIKSNNSSRSGSPDLDDGDDPDSAVSSPTMETKRTPMESGESPKAMFCPSPDVNTKADTFIARFRAGLRLEKMNSVRGRSNLGPDTREGEEGPSY
ncbi:probable LIM domain-containing serine/threonine-protein kinase DDB_G0286997 [Prunus avium]|uniref:Probable LIM domain-containing serine/threonine-protein kinase DDB_G0286997 n=1 Tax=Prunus avium TaxID=42229 RepID=A0A6P5SMA4_PRUAV|nr:probable LIM domain-containing serine/threonine-protein kinase DDB_G0286997 [Prunus avium]